MIAPPGAAVPYGTLDLIWLETLDGIGSLQGCAIARRIMTRTLGNQP